MSEVRQNLEMLTSLAAPRFSLESLPPICTFYETYSPALQFDPLYPRQKALLKLCFLELEEMTKYEIAVINQWRESSLHGGDVRIPYDIWDRAEYLKKNGYKHFREIIFCLGRRASKGFCGGHIGGYKTAQMLSIGNPQRHYGVGSGKDFYFQTMATTLKQAKNNLYMDVLNTVIGCSWFDPYISKVSDTELRLMTVNDKVRNEQEYQKAKSLRGHKDPRSIATIRIGPYAANPESLRGYTDYMLAFDEFAYGLAEGLKASSNELYHSAKPALRQFGQDGLILVPSTPVSQTGMFYELYEDSFDMDENTGKAKNPEMLCLQAPSWELFRDGHYHINIKKPLLVPPEEDESFAAEEARDPDRFAIEYRAKFANVLDSYLNPDQVDRMFRAYPSLEDNKNIPTKSARLDRTYFIHCDAGRVGDRFCMSMGHKELDLVEGVYHAYTDMQKVWQPSDFEPDENGVRTINYVEVMDFLVDILKRFHVTKLTFDQYQSFAFVDILNNERMKGKFVNSGVSITVDTHTDRNNLRRWERYKQAMYQGWVHAPYVEQEITGLGRICLLEREAKFLVQKNGKKVDHPSTGPITTNDLVDAHSTVVVNLLSDQLDAFNGSGLVRIEGAVQTNYMGAQMTPDLGNLEKFYEEQSRSFELDNGLIGTFGGGWDSW